MWIKSQKIIAGGNMFFSKNPDNYLPKTMGHLIFQNQKNVFCGTFLIKKYTDMCLMGVGTNILGYANQRVDKKF